MDRCSIVRMLAWILVGVILISMIDAYRGVSLVWVAISVPTLVLVIVFFRRKLS